MNDKLTEILARIGDKDNPATEDELKAARSEVAELLKEAAKADPPDIEGARALREGIDAIDAQIKEVGEAKAKEAEELKALLDGVDDDTEDEADPEEDAGSEEVAKVEKEPVAASLAKFSSAVNRTRQTIQRNAEAEERKNSNVRVSVVGQSTGFKLSDDPTLDEVSNLFSLSARSVTQGKQPLLRMFFDYPEDRQMSRQSKESNLALSKVFTPEGVTYKAIAASGGICGPLDADFSHPVLGDRSRPIKGALPSFLANRGGVRYQPAVSLADVADGVSVWTEANDGASSPSPATKDLLVLECEEEREAVVDAIVARVQVGNFQAKFTPEYYRSRLEALMIAHDRTAEIAAYTTIAAGSTAVTYAGADGTIYSVLSAIDKATAGTRSRLRIGRGRAFQAIMPDWALDALRSDISRQNISGSLDPLAAADQVLANFFAVRGVTPVWSPDTDLFGAQNAGDLLDYPGASADIILYPVGKWFFLDGGTLDLGTEIVDSTLNETNDRQAFMETFEKVADRGGESLKITVPIKEACQCAIDLGLEN